MNWPNHNLSKLIEETEYSSVPTTVKRIEYFILCPTEGTQGHVVSMVNSPIKGQRALIGCEIFQEAKVETAMVCTWEPVTLAAS